MSSLRRRHRLILSIVVAGLVASGVTAFPLLAELRLLCDLFGVRDGWLATVRDGLAASYAAHPWLGYGTDWLAFAHLVIALFFIGPWRDPVRNDWVLGAALVACAGVPVLAVVAGEVRGIPWGWRLIDCSFAAGAAPLLLYGRRLARRIAEEDGTMERPVPSGAGGA